MGRGGVPELLHGLSVLLSYVPEICQRLLILPRQLIHLLYLLTGCLAEVGGEWGEPSLCCLDLLYLALGTEELVSRVFETSLGGGGFSTLGAGRWIGRGEGGGWWWGLRCRLGAGRRLGGRASRRRGYCYLRSCQSTTSSKGVRGVGVVVGGRGDDLGARARSRWAGDGVAPQIGLFGDLVFMAHLDFLR